MADQYSEAVAVAMFKGTPAETPAPSPAIPPPSDEEPSIDDQPAQRPAPTPPARSSALPEDDFEP